MAVVDFSSAVISVVTSYSQPPISTPEANFNTDVLKDTNNTSIVSNNSRQTILNEPDKRIYQYTGTFTASGTEFYIYGTTPTPAIWKVSNISFNVGDTYSFKVPISIVIS